MKDGPIKAITRIAVAVSFDQRLHAIVRFAERFAVRTGASLKLIHVCDHWNQSALAVAAGYKVDGMGAAIDAEHQYVAEQRLHRLIDAMNPSIKIETAVVFGEVVPSLVAALEAMQADLVMIGTTIDERGDLLHGVGKATTLAQDSPVPVLVVNQTVGPEMLDQTLRILIADNLGPEGISALGCAMNLSVTLGGAHLLHSHVNTKQEIKSLADKIRAVSAGSFAPEEQAKDCFIQQRREIGHFLHDRAGVWLKALDGTGSEYQTEVTTGSVSEQIHQSANAHLSDVIVFGQHLLVHRGQGVNGGQMSYKTMFAQHRLVLVAPTAPSTD
jgi:nucleotide-binding universal stress UspA family protein